MCGAAGKGVAVHTAGAPREREVNTECRDFESEENTRIPQTEKNALSAPKGSQKACWRDLKSRIKYNCDLDALA